MLLLGYSFAQFMEIVLGIWVIRELYPEKREYYKWVRAILFILSVAWGMTSIWNAWAVFVSNSSLIVNSFCFSVLIFTYWKCPFEAAFIGEFFYNVTITLIKMLFLILKGVAEQKTISEINYGVRDFKEIIWCFVIYFLLIAMIHLKKDLLQLLKIVLCKYKKALLLIGSIEWTMLTYSMYLGKRGFSTTGFVLHLLFILCAVMIISYLMLNTLYQKIKVEKYMLDTFQNILEKQNEVLQTIYNRNSNKMHDVKHAMLFIGGCLEQGKIEEAQEQVSNYIGDLKEMEQKVWTNFPFLDFILNHKKAEMDEKEIEFELEVDLYSIPLEEPELGVVLGNLFDNAIEAARECVQQKRKIYLKIGNLNHMFLLSMRNTSIKAPQVKDGRLLTRKEDQYAHGLGVESVKRIVEKYNGSISFLYDDEHFEVNILI